MEAIKQAKNFLEEERRYNQDLGILASENAVIERLLKEPEEMRKVWIELGEKAGHRRFFEAIRGIVSIAAYWSPDKTRQIREGVRVCEEQAEEITRKARELAELIDIHREHRQRNCLSATIRWHPVDCMTGWANSGESGDGYLFNSYLKPELLRLMNRYDYKYWPTITDCLRNIAEDEQTNIFSDRTTADALRSRQWSNIDFVRALRSRLAEINMILTNKAMAAIANCVLELVDDAYTEDSMKKAIQRIKQGDN